MIEWLTRKVMAFCERRGRVLKIVGTAGPDDVYLIRYYVLQSRWMNIFIHQFLRSDRDDLHDHPWNFFTYLVRGQYTEKKWNRETGEVESTLRINRKDAYGYPPITQNRLVIRKAEDQHQVIVPVDLPYSQKDEATLTICVTGRTRREWGFWKILPALETADRVVRPTVRMWVPWKKYLGLDENAPSRG